DFNLQKMKFKHIIKSSNIMCFKLLKHHKTTNMRLPLLATLLLTTSVSAQTNIFSEDFESGTGLSSFTAGGVINSLTWQKTTNRGLDGGHSATNSAYFGNPTTFNFNTGYTEGAHITSSAISLAGPNKSFILSFNYFLETEGSLANFDQATVSVSTNGVNFTELFSNGMLVYNSTIWQSV